MHGLSGWWPGSRAGEARRSEPLTPATSRYACPYGRCGMLPLARIDASNAPPEEKEAAKSKLAGLLSHPLVTSIIGGIVGGAVGLRPPKFLPVSGVLCRA